MPCVWRFSISLQEGQFSDKLPGPLIVDDRLLQQMEMGKINNGFS
jgi:hypothetical protein